MNLEDSQSCRLAIVKVIIVVVMIIVVVTVVTLVVAIILSIVLLLIKVIVILTIVLNSSSMFYVPGNPMHLMSAYTYTAQPKRVVHTDSLPPHT